MAGRILNIPIKKIIDSPWQGRFFDPKENKNEKVRKQLDQLKASIRESGLLQPITVHVVGEDFEIIDGHRRVQAYKELGRGNIPAIIKDGTPKEIQTMSVVANLQRSDLTLLERAVAFEKILQNGVFESKKELSKSIGKDTTYVGDVINVLKLDKRILEHIAKFDSTNDVRLLRMIRQVGDTNEEGLCEAQFNLYMRYVHQNLSRQQVQNLVDNIDKPEPKQSYAIKSGKTGFSVKLTQKLSVAQKKRFDELLAEKMDEIMQEIGG